MRSTWMIGAMALTASAAGCGSDDGGSDARDASTTPDAGTKPDAGRLDAGIDAAAPSVVKCGSATCQAYPDVGSLSASPCCYAAATSTCSGIVEPLPNATCNRPAVDDATCPTVAVLGLPASGCCAESGHCGLNGNLLGYGCLDLSNLDVRITVEETLDGGTLPPITTCVALGG